MKHFWLFKHGIGTKDPDYQSLKPDPTIESEFIHVIEYSAYAAVEESNNRFDKLTTDQRHINNELQAKLSIVEEALRYFANPDIYVGTVTASDICIANDKSVLHDGLEVAKIALSRIGKHNGK